ADSLRAIDLLESLGRAYKGFSMTQARMTDSNAASVTIHRVAARDKAPVRDDRLMIGSATFGAGVALTLLLALVFKLMFRRANPVFDGEQTFISTMEPATADLSPDEVDTSQV